MQPDRLSSVEVQKTIDQLATRINERFPDANLAKVCRNLHELSLEADETIQWISRPNYWLRVGVAIVVLLLTVLLFTSLRQVDWRLPTSDVSNLVQFTEAAISELFLIGAGLITLMTYETRRKRTRVIKAVTRLRSFAHVVDAHQLTKDPVRLSRSHIVLPHSPSPSLNAYDMCRYLDYCSEMLALISKLGFLLVQDFPDPVATESVNDLESLSTGLSRKMWQKVMIIRMETPDLVLP